MKTNSVPMTTKQKDAMMAFVCQEAASRFQRDKLERAYKAGFAAREEEIDGLRKHIELLNGTKPDKYEGL